MDINKILELIMEYGDKRQTLGDLNAYFGGDFNSKKDKYFEVEKIFLKIIEELLSE